MNTENFTTQQLIEVIKFTATNKKISSGNIAIKFKIDKQVAFPILTKMEELGIVSKKQPGSIFRNVLVDSDEALKIINENIK